MRTLTEAELAAVSGGFIRIPNPYPSPTPTPDAPAPYPDPIYPSFYKQVNTLVSPYWSTS